MHGAMHKVGLVAERSVLRHKVAFAAGWSVLSHKVAFVAERIEPCLKLRLWRSGVC